MQIFLGNNYFGAGNFGDDLSLAGFLHVAQLYPSFEIAACTAYDIASQRRRFPWIKWLPDRPDVREAAINLSQLWVAVGDTPFQLDSGPWSVDHNELERQRCLAAGKPMYLIGVGCESGQAASDSRSQNLLSSAQFVWTRDQSSAELLQPFIDPSRLDVGADLAHLAFTDEMSGPASDTSEVGLLLAFERLEQIDLSELERFIQVQMPGRTRWLVQEARIMPYVERWILHEIAPEVRSALAIMNLDFSICSIQEYLAEFGAPEIVVTSRYHGALVAAWQGSKILVISRSRKLEGIARELDLPQLHALGSQALLDDAVSKAVRVPRERMLELRERAREMCGAFFEMVSRELPTLDVNALQ